MTAFWSAGRALNLGLDPYRARDVAERWTPSGAPYPFYSPVFVAEYMRLLGALPFSLAKLIWLSISIALSFVVLLLLHRIIGAKLSLATMVTGFAVIVAFNPFSFTLSNAQSDVLVVFSIALSWYLLGKDKLYYAGLALCMGAVNPHLIPGVVIYYVFRALVYKEWCLIAGGATGAAALAAVSIPYWDYMWEWLTQILPVARTEALAASIQLTMFRFFCSFMSVIPATLAGAFIQVIAVLIALRFWIRSRNKNTNCDIAVAVALTLVITIYAYNQDYLLLSLTFPAIHSLWRGGLSSKKLGLLVTAVSLQFSGMGGNLIPVRSLLFVSVAPFLVLLMLGSNEDLLRAVKDGGLPWFGVWGVVSVGVYLLSLWAGSVANSAMLIQLGLLTFLAGMLKRAGPGLLSENPVQ